MLFLILSLLACQNDQTTAPVEPGSEPIKVEVKPHVRVDCYADSIVAEITISTTADDVSLNQFNLGSKVDFGHNAYAVLIEEGKFSSTTWYSEGPFWRKLEARNEHAQVNVSPGHPASFRLHVGDHDDCPSWNGFDPLLDVVRYYNLTSQQNERWQVNR